MSVVKKSATETKSKVSFINQKVEHSHTRVIAKCNSEDMGNKNQVGAY